MPQQQGERTIPWLVSPQATFADPKLGRANKTRNATSRHSGSLPPEPGGPPVMRLASYAPRRLLSAGAAPTSHRVLGCFDRTRSDDFPSRSGLEYSRLFGEGINAGPLLGRRLFYDDKFRKSWNEERAILLQFLITNSRKRLHDAFDVAPLELRVLGNLADKFRLRHGLRHKYFS